MKRILLILILLISVSTAYAEPQICFDKKDSSNIVVQLEKYDICKEKNIAFNNMSIELQHQIDILNGTTVVNTYTSNMVSADFPKGPRSLFANTFIFVFEGFN